MIHAYYVHVKTSGDFFAHRHGGLCHYRSDGADTGLVPHGGISIQEGDKFTSAVHVDEIFMSE